MDAFLKMSSYSTPYFQPEVTEDENFYYLKKIIEDLMSRNDVVFMTSSQIGDWFIKEDGSYGEGLKPFLESPPK